MDQLPGCNAMDQSTVIEHCIAISLLKYFISKGTAKLEQRRPQNVRVEQVKSNTNYLFSVAFFSETPYTPPSFSGMSCMILSDLQNTGSMPFSFFFFSTEFARLLPLSRQLSSNQRYIPKKDPSHRMALQDTVQPKQQWTMHQPQCCWWRIQNYFATVFIILYCSLSKKMPVWQNPESSDECC